VRLGGHEQRLPALRGVREAVAVVLVGEAPGRARPAAVVTVAGPASFDPAEAGRRSVAGDPEALLPAGLVVLYALPRLTDGETGRRAVRTACEVAADGVDGPAGGPLRGRDSGPATAGHER